MSLSDLQNQMAGVETSVERDSLGGNIRESGVVPMRIKLAYSAKAKSGALGFTTVLVDAEGGEYRDTQYITGGDAKGNNPFYVKNGKKFPLPGYEHVDNLTQLVLNKSLLALEEQVVTIKLYNADLKKEAPTEVTSYPELAGASVRVAFLKVRENKSVKQGNTYVPTNEEQISNVVAKFFDGDTGKTKSELVGQSEASFITDWETKFKGTTKDTYKEIPNAAKTAVNGASPFASGYSNTPKASSGLFADDA